jgi:hypothetical protein
MRGARPLELFVVMSPKVHRLRNQVKSAVASALAKAHDHGLAGWRHSYRPLVIGYHRIVEDFDAESKSEMPSMLTSIEMFKQHLDCLGRSFRFVSLDDIGERLLNGQPFEEPVAAITFDDGYRDVYELALPILERKGIPGAMFVVTDLVGRPTWQIHDKLYHLVAKAFRCWDDPRSKMFGTLWKPLPTLSSSPFIRRRMSSCGSSGSSAETASIGLPIADRRVRSCAGRPSSLSRPNIFERGSSQQRNALATR